MTGKVIPYTPEVYKQKRIIAESNYIAKESSLKKIVYKCRNHTSYYTKKQQKGKEK